MLVLDGTTMKNVDDASLCALLLDSSLITQTREKWENGKRKQKNLAKQG